MKNSLFNIIGALVISVSSFVSPAAAETWFYAQDPKMPVAIEKANIGAILGADNVGSCIHSFANSETCRLVSGNWECRAAYHNHSKKKKCGGNDLQADFDRAVSSLKALCEGYESQCMAAVGL